VPSLCKSLESMARREGEQAQLASRPPWSLRSHSPLALRSRLPLRFEAGFAQFQKAPKVKDFGHLAHLAGCPFGAKRSKVPPPVPPLCNVSGSVRAKKRDGLTAGPWDDRESSDDL
jgi:hypothetical protein